MEGEIGNYVIVEKFLVVVNRKMEEDMRVLFWFIVKVMLFVLVVGGGVGGVIVGGCFDLILWLLWIKFVWDIFLLYFLFCIWCMWFVIVDGVFEMVGMIVSVGFIFYEFLWVSKRYVCMCGEWR